MGRQSCPCFGLSDKKSWFSNFHESEIKHQTRGLGNGTRLFYRVARALTSPPSPGNPAANRNVRNLLFNAQFISLTALDCRYILAKSSQIIECVISLNDQCHKEHDHDIVFKNGLQYCAQICNLPTSLRSGQMTQQCHDYFKRTSQHRFDVIMTLSLCRVSVGLIQIGGFKMKYSLIVEGFYCNR